MLGWIFFILAIGFLGRTFFETLGFERGDQLMQKISGANYSARKRVLIVDLSMKPISRAMWHVVSPAPLISDKFLILFNI